MPDRTPGGRRRRLDQMEREHAELADTLPPTSNPSIAKARREARLDLSAERERQEREAAAEAYERETDELARLYGMRP